MAGEPAVEDVQALWRSPDGPRAKPPGPPPAALATADRPNILLLTVDSLRYDRLGLGGHDRATSPNLDMLSRISHTFHAAWSPSNYTGASLYSLVTGLYPSAFLEGEAVVARPGIELAFQLKKAGYHTKSVELKPTKDQLLSVRLKSSKRRTSKPKAQAKPAPKPVAPKPKPKPKKSKSLHQDLLD